MMLTTVDSEVKQRSINISACVQNQMMHFDIATYAEIKRSTVKPFRPRYQLVTLTLASRKSMLTFRLVLVFACSAISYSPVTRTSLWISSRRHFREFTGKKKEIENTASKRTGNSSSAVSRAMATFDQGDQPDRSRQPTSLTPSSNSYNRLCWSLQHHPLAWRENRPLSPEPASMIFWWIEPVCTRTNELNLYV